MSERPKIVVEANTANSTAVSVVDATGCRKFQFEMIIFDDRIIIHSKGKIVEVRP